MKEREIDLLQAISQDETATQANLATELGMAVGSVNWYIKRLIRRGYLKATRMDRTRLRYNMTPEGLEVLRRRATQYVKDSLKVYKDLRKDAKAFIAMLMAQGIESVHVDGEDEALDIFRLSCMEANLNLNSTPGTWVVRHTPGGYKLFKEESK